MDCFAALHSYFPFLLSRPHFPVSKLTVCESYETYISRSFQVTRDILTECKNLGTVDSVYDYINTMLVITNESNIFKLHCKSISISKIRIDSKWHWQHTAPPPPLHTGNTVLIVAHASSLEACTRQIQGLTPQNSKDFVQVVRKVSLLLRLQWIFHHFCLILILFCIHDVHHLLSVHADSLSGFLRLWRNGRQRGVAAGRPAHPASDSWTQSQFQLARDAHARLKEMLPCILLKTCTAEYLSLTHTAMSDQKTEKQKQMNMK